ncbi:MULTISPECIES: glycosyltransferase [unclassified Rhizobium]|uniref:glycosyltransferase n=1 Tax=unclassified Rhizobium TaxID=2613769 RepID=UPI00216A8706|nr:MULTISPECIES: glycosyltransferase [unclassified Rhizobium]MCS3742195.1 glycosyltransferase involved in cell wall biosynthesis [Rhizobium sp. BK661]MCS4094122.1 glycosyltransferase involved in cell wall biosynthesis [Rhizobium sp. BK176]
MNHRISVVLATYNGERYLSQQLESLTAQTVRPFEIIISDDDSTDTTPELLAAFEKSAPFPILRWKNTPGLGFRENFLRAASKASGDWIAFCDQDDIWRRDKLEVCQRLFEDGVTQVVHQAELIDNAGTKIGLFSQGIETTRIRPPLFYDVWDTFLGFSMIVRRDVLDILPSSRRFVDYIEPNHLIAHDRWGFFLAQTLGKTAEIAEPLVYYRQHSSNLFGKSGRKQVDGDIRLKNKGYIDATRGMLACVEGMPATAETRFPGFRRQAALKVYASALRQVEARGNIYELAGHLAFAEFMRLVSSGCYRGAQDGRLRWRSLARDLAFCFGMWNERC